MPHILKNEGYPDVMAFMKTYRQMEDVVERYEREVWEYNLRLKQKEKPPKNRPKRKVSESSSDSFRQRANSRRETKRHLTEKGNFD